NVLVFDTKGGELTVKRKGNQIEMDFPMGSTRPEPNNDMLLERFLGEKPVAMHSDADLCLIEVESSNTIKNLEPNFALLQEHPKKRFFITAKSSDKGYDFISRVFAPDYGIDEDPVTGSAHCYLANYWSQKLSKNTVVGYQASKRGGVVECEIFG